MDEDSKGFPLGTYTSSGDDEPWTHTFAPDGTFSVASNAGMLVEGTYVVTGDQIEITDERGPRAAVEAKPGTYRWSVDQQQLMFTVVEDEVEGRVTALATHPWIRQA